MREGAARATEHEAAQDQEAVGPCQGGHGGALFRRYEYEGGVDDADFTAALHSGVHLASAPAPVRRTGLLSQRLNAIVCLRRLSTAASGWSIGSMHWSIMP